MSSANETSIVFWCVLAVAAPAVPSGESAATVLPSHPVVAQASHGEIEEHVGEVSSPIEEVAVSPAVEVSSPDVSFQHVEWSPSAEAFALAEGLSGHVEAIKAQFQGLWPDMSTYVEFDEQQQKLVAWFVVTKISDEDWDQAFDLESEFWDSVPADQRDLLALLVTENDELV